MNHNKTSLILAGALALVALPNVFAGHPVGHEPYTMFKTMDTDNDGQLTRAEHVAGSKQLFADMDTNRDGQVTAAEMTALYAVKADQPAKTDEPAQVGKPAAGEMTALIIKLNDTNKDGQLSAAEHAAGDEAMFTKLDQNIDGWLSQSECEAGKKMMKKDR